MTCKTPTLNPRLVELRDRIAQYTKEHGYAPVIRDMQRWFKTSRGTPISTSQVHALLAQAAEVGLVRMPPPGMARGVVPLYPNGVTYSYDKELDKHSVSMVGGGGGGGKN